MKLKSLLIAFLLIMMATAIQSSPSAFTKNIGQWPDSILFRGECGDATIWIVRDGFYYQFTKQILSADAQPQIERLQERSAIMMRHDFSGQNDSLETCMIKVAFVGANGDAHVFGKDRVEYSCNFFLGKDSSHWKTDVPNYCAVIFQRLHGGTDLTLFYSEDGLSLAATLDPQATPPSLPVIYLAGKTAINPVSDTTVVTTPLGDVRFCNGLIVSNIDRENPMSISRRASDNNFLLYSTFLGGTDRDEGFGVAVDSGGHAFVTGYTYSANFPTLSASDSTLGISSADAFITKLSRDGSGLVYSTFLGGDAGDIGFGIVVDSMGQAYVTGQTGSINFPTINAYDSSYNGAGSNPGLVDVFVSKLSASGSALLYSTYLGGSNIEYGQAITMNKSGEVFVTGATASTNFPTVDPFDADYNGGPWDIFVSKLSALGTDLVYSTILGGNQLDVAFGVVVDSADQAVVVGTSHSSNFPTKNPIGVASNGTDAVITTLSSAGLDLVFSTFLGEGAAYGIAIDSKGWIYVTGGTSSLNFPVVKPLDSTLGGNADAFLCKLSPLGGSPVFCTYLGGSELDVAHAISVDNLGQSYLTGQTYSADYPIKGEHFVFNDFDVEGFVTKVNSTGSSILYSTFLGGTGVDYGNSIVTSDKRVAYITGRTTSIDFPVKNAFDSTFNSPLYHADDGFVTALFTIGPLSCCDGPSGNIDCDPGNGVDISDLSALIDNLYVSFSPLYCPAEANVDGQPGIDISDLSTLIDLLYISFTPLAPCL